MSSANQSAIPSGVRTNIDNRQLLHGCCRQMAERYCRQMAESGGRTLLHPVAVGRAAELTLLAV